MKTAKPVKLKVMNQTKAKSAVSPVKRVVSKQREITLSVVIPAYNEAERITLTLKSLHEYFKGKKISYEVIVVDDGSTDNTPDVVRAYAKHFKNLKVLVNVDNQGKGYSVNRGMFHARGRYRLFMDADNSVDISHADSFIDYAQEGYQVVIGSISIGETRVIEHSGWHRRILGNASKLLIRMMARPGVSDTQRGFKLFSADAADAIFSKQTIHRFGFDIEVLVIARKNGFSVKELPVFWDNPAGSKVTLKSYFQTFTELAKIARNAYQGKYTAQS